MSNFKLSLLSFFGLFPKTSVIEAKQTALEEEYKRFIEFEKSDELKQFQALDSFVHSEAFAKERERIKSLTFKNTEQWKQLQEFTQLKNSASIKTYFSVLASENLKFFNQFDISPLKKRFEELDTYFKSEEYKNFQTSLSEKRNQLIALQKEYMGLKNSSPVKLFFKIEASSDLQKYNQCHSSEKLSRYNELDLFMKSDELKQIKQALEDQKKEIENRKKSYLQLKSDKSIKNYFSIEQSNELKNLNQVENSSQIEDLENLGKQVNSQQFIEAKANKKEFKNSEFFKTEQDYLKLKNTSSLKSYFKFKVSEKYQSYLKVKDAEILKEYQQLNTFVNSPDFSKKLEALKYSNTEEFKKEEEFKKLVKDAEIGHYFKFGQSLGYKHYISFCESDTLSRFKELDSLVNSDDFKQKMLAAEFKNSDIYKQLREYEGLKKSNDIIRFYKFKDSVAYKTYLQVSESNELKRYNELDAIIQSDDFIQFKTYMEDSKKWLKSEEYAKEQDYLKQSKTEKIQWFFKLKKSIKFEELIKWQITFEDHFDQPKLDTSKWMTSYFWGKMLLKESYVLANDRHYLTEGKNLEFGNSFLGIVTRKEKVTGKAWNKDFGFMPKDFNYTSGIISTAHSFRQKYGRFEAKIKFNHGFPVYQAFWLKGEKITPEVDIAKYHHKNPKSIFVANHWENGGAVKQKNVKTGGLSFNGQPYIFSLTWTPTELVWRINSVVINRQTEGIPDEPMYLILNAGLTGELPDVALPNKMEVDWVRCFEMVENTN